MPEREVAAAAAAATTAARDVEAQEQPTAAAEAAVPAPRAGAVSQQNTSPCGGTGSARGETEELKPAPGRRRPSTSRRRGLQPSFLASRPGLARRRAESGSGSGGSVDRAS